MEEQIVELMTSPDVKNVILGCEMALNLPPMTVSFRRIVTDFVEELAYYFVADMESHPHTGIFTMSKHGFTQEDGDYLYDYTYINVDYHSFKIIDLEYHESDDTISYEYATFREWEYQKGCDRYIKIFFNTPEHHFKFIIEKILEYARKTHGKGSTMPPAHTEAIARPESEDPERERVVGRDASSSVFLAGSSMLSLWNPQAKR